jgi:hypothetical protein
MTDSMSCTIWIDGCGHSKSHLPSSKTWVFSITLPLGASASKFTCAPIRPPWPAKSRAVIRNWRSPSADRNTPGAISL